MRRPPSYPAGNQLARQRAFTLVEIMIVIGIIGMLLAIAVPALMRARAISQQTVCQETMAGIDQAKQTWALQNRMPGTAEPDWTDLIGPSLYLRSTPVCPGSGTYTINSINVLPECSLSTALAFPHVYVGS